MKVLFAGLHLACFRNFESAIRELAVRGHQVHLTGDEPEAMGGEDLARRLASDHPGRITWDQLPSLEREPWYDAARRMRVALDYVRVLERRYPSKLRLRAEERTARMVRWASGLPGGRPATLAALKRFERLMPTSEALVQHLRRQAADLVVLTSLTYSRSQQLDVLKAARAVRIPVAAAIMSWDHLSSKALLHVVPDMVIVWNEIQKREAVEMHGLPAERVVVTGAQCYDQWFTRKPERSRAAFCGAVGLRADRPFVLWVHSALSPTPDPPEPRLVTRWIDALRRSADPRLREMGVLVRPHPERLKEWAGIGLDGYENVAFHGRNPIDRDAKNDYFDSLYYSSAVVGLVTSAFLEAAVVGRPVLTFTLPEYRIHQEEMIHFQYLMDVEGGLLHTAPDLDAHLRQLADVAAPGRARDDRNRRFIGAFIRPAGIDAPATPAFVEALERLHQGVGFDASPDNAGAWLRPAVATVASWSRTGLGRWLMNDMRDDASDEHEERTQRSIEARTDARAERHRAKLRRRQRRIRRDALMRRGKEIKSAVRKFRHRTVTTMYRGAGKCRHVTAVGICRGMQMIGLWRGELPGSTGKE
jgi:GNAT superfamily N-acetyltransferase